MTNNNKTESKMKELILSQIPIEELIEKIAERINKNNSTNIIKEPKKFLSISELCSEYGFAKPTLYSLTSKRKIPFIKKGKRLLFEREKIEIWLQQSRKKTKFEIKEEFEQGLNNKLGGDYEK